ncbi:MAG TPA: hypothetical protein VI756_32545 [Blastocatellia bacterium]
MRVKILTMGVVVVVLSTIMIGDAVAAVSRGQNANKPAASGSHKKAAPAAKPAAGAAAGSQASATGTPAAKKAPAHRRRVQARATAGVPSGGVGACADRLSKLAEKDPLPKYEGTPEEIVNNGLLWNDPHSKCAVTDEAMREKVFSLATAWREGKGDQVRSLIGEIKASAPAPEATPASHRRHKA